MKTSHRKNYKLQYVEAETSSKMGIATKIVKMLTLSDAREVLGE